MAGALKDGGKDAHHTSEINFSENKLSIKTGRFIYKETKTKPLCLIYPEIV